MDFAHTDKVRLLQQRLTAFMVEHVYPAEPVFFAEIQESRRQGNPWVPTVIMEELKEKARAVGLWNLFLPQSERGAGILDEG